MTRRVRGRVLRIVAAIMSMFAILEVGVRVIGETDIDGQFRFQGRRVQPYVLPVERTAMRLAALDAAIDEAGEPPLFTYDAVLGWSPRPNATGLGGLWTSNDAAIRAAEPYETVPQDGVLRIALFGGSFTAGDEVADAETWAQTLETSLNAAGVATEVLNFGVNGFGTDQAYLRWQSIGQTFRPDIVILGFMPENIMRNVNIFRPVYLPNANFIYSKPRYVLQNGRLTTVNSTPLTPTEMLEALRAFPNHELAEHEYHYQAKRPWWSYSRFVAVVVGIASDFSAVRNNQLPEREREAYFSLTNTLVYQFGEDVREDGTVFMVAYLPGNLAVINQTAERK
ncbi:MAG: SGNH/GDSL hydrolase family protein, partial [Chloroflexota bacterium]